MTMTDQLSKLELVSIVGRKLCLLCLHATPFVAIVG